MVPTFDDNDDDITTGASAATKMAAVEEEKTLFQLAPRTNAITPSNNDYITKIQSKPIEGSCDIYCPL